MHVFICQLYSKLQFGEFVPVTGIYLCFAQVGLSVENGCFRFENGGTYQLALSFSGTNLRRFSIKSRRAILLVRRSLQLIPASPV